MTKITVTAKTAKPFIKWAGGKGQLLNELRLKYPAEEKITKYCEPFVGGGAVLFDITSQYELDRVLINDINKELMLTYMAIRDDVENLLTILQPMEEEYLSKTKESRQAFYYEKRRQFNEIKISKDLDDITLASLFIFLNRTCFNGLYRVNSRGEFNVPMGNYKNPSICDTDNLRRVSGLLKKVDIKTGDYNNCINFIDKNTFVYIDPPYRPITKTASFTSYSASRFDDDDQLRLGVFVGAVHDRGAKMLLSNSDPTNAGSDDSFFDDLYKQYRLERVSAKRMINCDGNNRGNINEILVKNY